MTVTAAARVPKRECDLVMKGGITSGVVYPIAIRKIAAEYRFRNLGGASAGAIAAVAAAACEFRRHSGVEDAFDALVGVGTEISREGFVKNLFQPRPKAAPAFEVGLDLVTSAGSAPGRLTKAAVSILRVRARFLIGATLAVLAWAAVVGIAIWAVSSGGASTSEAVAIALIALVALPVAALLVAAIAAVGLFHFVTELNDALKETWFGMCSGRTEPGHPENSGLTDWLYETIQKCAGLPADQPLTFALLRGQDEDDPLVNLQLVTTDLSASRPVILPLVEPENESMPYLFDPDEWRKLFPHPVVEQMLVASANVGPPLEHGARTFYPVPGFELPVVVAARLSLSFPILLATVPLWRADGHEGELVQHTMSDGGICSNFPIHFFDSLFPGRPTFGLDLQPWRVATESAVEMSDAPRKPGSRRPTGSERSSRRFSTPLATGATTCRRSFLVTGIASVRSA